MKNNKNNHNYLMIYVYIIIINYSNIIKIIYRFIHLQVGAYLKTPILPMWLTKCDGQLGLLFNPNKDIFRNKAAENKYVIIIIIDR